MEFIVATLAGKNVAKEVEKALKPYVVGVRVIRKK